MPVWRCRSESKSRICPRSVTSSAVVGSSASSSWGSLASAMAIMARWRCPPESWCGKLPARLAGSGMPVFASNSIAACAHSAPVKPFFSIKISAICWPMVMSGLSAVMGSWKTMAMSPPRTPRISRSESCSRSRPANRAWPSTAASPSRRSRLSAVIVLPEPDSPTSASFSPRAISKPTPRTTDLAPKRTCRSRTCSKGVAGLVLCACITCRPFVGPGHRARHRP